MAANNTEAATRPVEEGFGEDLDNKDQESGGKLDNMQILQNIRNLMRLKNVKVGAVETDAGCTLGYMSRVEKKEGSMAPSLAFVFTAAEMLGVSVEMLVKGKLDTATTTDLYILEFISKLIDQTNKEQTHWDRIDLSKTSRNNPFVTSDKTEFVRDKEKGYIKRFKFESSFYKDARLYTGAESYFATLNNSDNRIYLVTVECEFSKGDGAEVYMEAYVTDADNKISPLFNTYSCNASLKAAAEALYKSAQMSSRVVNVAAGAKSIIDQFMTTTIA